MSNFLILSAGRRFELYSIFKRELSLVSPFSVVYVSDIEPSLSPVCSLCSNFIQLPSFNDPDFLTELHGACLSYDISVVIPTIDTGLDLLSQASESQMFVDAGICILVSSLSLIQAASDKIKTADLMSRIGISCPEIYNKASLRFPCFGKPISGSSSEGIAVFRDISDVPQSLLLRDDYMFSYFVPSEYQECTVDMFFDRNNCLKCAVPRVRLSTRSGEVDKSVTCAKEFLYQKILEHFSVLPGALGPVTFQCFYNEAQKLLYAIEINPRFAGGFPLSDASGANFVAMIFDHFVSNKPIAFCDDWVSGRVMLRYDNSCFFDLD